VTRMTSDKKMDRRTVLAAIGSAGLGWGALGSTPVYGWGTDDNILKTILPNFTEKSHKILSAVTNVHGYSGEIPAAKVKELMDLEGKTSNELMIALLPLARTYARPPISKFFVGGVAKGVSGSLYFGGNLEFEDLSLSYTVHSEQAALANAYMHSDAGISAIAVTAVPCGHCRQFMNDVSLDGQMEILLEGKPPAKLLSLLPMRFGPQDMGFKDGAFPVKEVDLALTNVTSDELLHASLEAARKSYGRYTGALSGIALATKAGRIYKGSYIEIAAFNPSLSPLQIALVGLIVAGEDYSAISRAVLTEVEGAKISQKGVTEALLGVIAPGVRLEVASANRKS
jgi:cytidine deaminase